MAGNPRSFEQRLFGHYDRPKRKSTPKDNKASDYLALGVVPPYALLCGLMVVAGMMALSGLLELALAAGFITLIINYVRFDAYAPSLFSKFPWTLFKEINEKGERTEDRISDKKRLYLMNVFVFGFSVISATGLTFFSLMLMKEAFISLGMIGIMSLGGYSLVPALIFFGAASFLCTWPMFSDGASNLFARKDLWARLKVGMKKFFGVIPDESLLLPDERLESVGARALFGRQMLRMVLVLALLGLAAFGNFVVAFGGFDYMFSIMGLGGAGIGPAKMILSMLALVGGSVFITSVLTQLMTLGVLGIQFAWRQYMLPVDATIKDQPLLRYGLALFAAPVLLPLFILRGLIGFVLMEYTHLKDTLFSSHIKPDAEKSFFHDTDTVYERIRCNTQNSFVNGLVNTFIITPATFIIGTGIFLSQHIKFLAFLNAVNSGVTSFNGQASTLSNALSITGYGGGAWGFGWDGGVIRYLNGPRQPLAQEETPKPPLKMVLFGYALNPRSKPAPQEQPSARLESNLTI